MARRRKILVIPCGGAQTRFPLDNLKCLTVLPNGETCLGRIIRQSAGLVDELIVVASLQTRVELLQFLKEDVHKEYLPNRVKIATQHGQLGDAHAVYTATSYVPISERVNSDFLVIWGDQYSVERKTLTLLLERAKALGVRAAFPTAPRRDPYTLVLRDPETSRFHQMEFASSFDPWTLYGVDVGSHIDFEEAHATKKFESDCGVFLFRAVDFMNIFEPLCSQQKEEEIKKIKFISLLKFFPQIVALKIGTEKETFGLNDEADLKRLESQ